MAGVGRGTIHPVALFILISSEVCPKNWPALACLGVHVLPGFGSRLERCPSEKNETQSD